MTNKVCFYYVVGPITRTNLPCVALVTSKVSIPKERERERERERDCQEGKYKDAFVRQEKPVRVLLIARVTCLHECMRWREWKSAVGELKIRATQTNVLPTFLIDIFKYLIAAGKPIKGHI